MSEGRGTKRSEVHSTPLSGSEKRAVGISMVILYQFSIAASVKVVSLALLKSATI